MFQTNHAATEAAVLRVNAAFYRAFSRGDYEAMSALWAERAPVACIHPTLPALVGRQAVLSSWRQMLKDVPPFELRCDRPLVRLFGDTAIVACQEGNGDRPAHLVATNIFVLENGEWRMVHHHAGPVVTAVSKPHPPSLLN